MLFRKQPGFCSVCGKEGEYEYASTAHGGSVAKVCSQACNEEANWRYTLYVMGKEYYPRPTDK